jgi:hypothetical protein
MAIETGEMDADAKEEHFKKLAKVLFIIFRYNVIVNLQAIRGADEFRIKTALAEKVYKKSIFCHIICVCV